jgi:hypothetical protein
MRKVDGMQKGMDEKAIITRRKRTRILEVGIA